MGTVQEIKQAATALSAAERDELARWLAEGAQAGIFTEGQRRQDWLKQWRELVARTNAAIGGSRQGPRWRGFVANRLEKIPFQSVTMSARAIGPKVTERVATQPTKKAVYRRPITVAKFPVLCVIVPHERR